MEPVFALIGTVVSYGGMAAGIAYLLFQHLGKKWIDSRFDARLEQLRHQQAVELQRLRMKIDAMLSGAIRLQTMEFDALTEAWRLLQEAYGAVGSVVSPMQQYPNLDRYTDRELEEFLAVSELQESEKDRVRNADKKGSTYADLRFYPRIHEAKRSYAKLREHLSKHGISIPDAIHTELMRLADILWGAIIDKEVGHEAGDRRMQNEGWEKLQQAVKPGMNSLRTTIRQQLTSHSEAVNSSETKPTTDDE